MKKYKDFMAEANISRTDAEPKSPDEKRFKDKHVAQVTDYPVAGTSDTLNGKTMKKDMSKSAGYHEKEDEEVYESVEKVKPTMEQISYDDAKKRLQKMKKGSSVSFTHATTGKKVTGEYKGLRNMGGRSYAHVEHGDGATRVPVHQIHQVQ